MTATRSITWGIPSTTSRMASRIIIPATFTARRNPGTVSQSLLRLRDFRARTTTTSGMLEATCSVVLPDFHRDVGKNCYGWKENCISAKAVRERALSSVWVCMCECELCVYVYVCVYTRRHSLQSKLRFLTWKRKVDSKNRKLASTATIWYRSCVQGPYIKLPKVKLYRYISWPSWSEFFLNESMEVLFSLAFFELYTW